MTWNLKKRATVVVDNDWAGDPDGLVALAHHALSPADDVVAVTGTGNNPMFGDPTGSSARAAAYARELLDLIGDHETTAVVAGRDTPCTGERRDNAAAQAIVDVVRTADASFPIVVVCGGPLTNVADALLVDPSIADRITLAWVGGTRQEGAFEYNRATDEKAAEIVFSHDDLAIDQFPKEVYEMLAVSVAETEDALTSSGPVGTWLWQKYLDLGLPPEADVNPVWPLGDSAPLAVTALAHSAVRFEPGPRLSRHRVCTALDPRLVFGDLVSRLRLHARAAADAPR